MLSVSGLPPRHRQDTFITANYELEHPYFEVLQDDFNLLSATTHGISPTSPNSLAGSRFDSLFLKLQIAPTTTLRPVESCSKCKLFSRDPTQLDDRGIIVIWDPQTPQIVRGTIRFKITCPCSHHGRCTGYKLTFIVMTQSGNEVCRQELEQLLLIAQFRKRDNDSSAGRKKPKKVTIPSTSPPPAPIASAPQLPSQLIQRQAYLAPVIQELQPPRDTVVGGMFITIKGLNFQLGDYTVFFGTSPTTAFKVDETTLICCVPTAPGLRPEVVCVFIWDPSWGKPQLNAPLAALERGVTGLLFEYTTDSGDADIGRTVLEGTDAGT